MKNIKCDVCGKFISYADLEENKATVRMVTPDSAYTSEQYESLCKKHTSEYDKGLNIYQRIAGTNAGY